MPRLILKVLLYLCASHPLSPRSGNKLDGLELRTYACASCGHSRTLAADFAQPNAAPMAYCHIEDGVAWRERQRAATLRCDEVRTRKDVGCNYAHYHRLLPGR